MNDKKTTTATETQNPATDAQNRQNPPADNLPAGAPIDDTPAGDNLPAPSNANAPAVIVQNDASGKPVPIETMESIVANIEAGKALGDITRLEVGTVNLKTEYLSFEDKGQEVRRIFLGFTLRPSVDPGTGEDKGLLPAAQLYDPTTETINICMQTVLVGVLYELQYPKGQAVQITYKGDRKNSKGLKYQDFDIRALIPAKK